MGRREGLGGTIAGFGSIGRRSHSSFWCVFGSLGALKGRCVLLKRCLGSFLEQGVHTLVQVIARHVVVDYTKTLDVHSALVVSRLDVVVDLGELALLLDYFDSFATAPTLTPRLDTLLFQASFLHGLSLRCDLLIKDVI